jgi:hypothetical protein
MWFKNLFNKEQIKQEPDIAELTLFIGLIIEDKNGSETEVKGYGYKRNIIKLYPMYNNKFTSEFSPIFNIANCNKIIGYGIFTHKKGGCLIHKNKWEDKDCLYVISGDTIEMDVNIKFDMFNIE